MTYSQPQQPQYRPNRTALWVNDRKSAANQPDYKGNLELSYALVQELLAAFNAGQYTQDRGGQPCIKLDIALYAQQVAPGDKKPILSGQLSTLADTQRGAAARQQAAQQYGQGQAPTPMPQQVPQQSQHVQPQPQQQPQALEGWPAHVPVPAGFVAPQQPMAPPAPAQPIPGAIHGQPPAPVLPANF